MSFERFWRKLTYLTTFHFDEKSLNLRIVENLVKRFCFGNVFEKHSCFANLGWTAVQKQWFSGSKSVHPDQPKWKWDQTLVVGGLDFLATDHPLSWRKNVCGQLELEFWVFGITRSAQGPDCLKTDPNSFWKHYESCFSRPCPRGSI